MKHCSSCLYCTYDSKALHRCGILIKKCGIDDHLILHPFWRGFRCKKYEKRTGGE